MKIYGITIDADKIAAGLVEMVDDMPEEYESALRLGMLPAPLMDSLSGMLGEKFDQIARPAYSEAVAAFGENEGDFFDSIINGLKTEYEQKRKDFISKVSHAVSLGMYKVAPMVV